MEVTHLRAALSLFIAGLMVGCGPTKKSDELDLQIVYNVHYDTATGNYEVFVMDLDGKNPKNISNSPAVDWAYCSFADKIYFASDRDTTSRFYFLYEMDANGNSVRKVSELRLEDSWMSTRNDGKEIVVSGRLGKQVRTQLFLIDIASGEYRQITTDTAASFVDPVFSPNGEQIAFRHRTNRRNYEYEKAEIWIMNADGTGKRQLTHYPRSDTTAAWHDYHAGPPVWNPKTNRISYMSMQKGNYSIFSISPDGAGATQLTPDSLSEGWHSYSPDGEQMVFDVSDLAYTWYNIYAMKPDGTGVIQLTNDWRTEQAPLFVRRKR